MGRLLVAAAYEHANRLRLAHLPTRLLVYMAHVAYDPGNSANVAPCLFFESRAAMMRAVGGGDVPDRKPDADLTYPEHREHGDDGEACPCPRCRWAAGDAMVKRALGPLTKAGVVVQTRRGTPGFNAEFELRVSAVDPEEAAAAWRHLESTVTVPAEDGERTSGRTATVPDEDAHRAPEQKQQDQQEPEQNNAPSLTPLACTPPSTSRGNRTPRPAAHDCVPAGRLAEVSR
ncbi:MAG: hypothetical protein AB7G36_18715 [Candidatus Nanopelagicales bacterium]